MKWFFRWLREGIRNTEREDEQLMLADQEPKERFRIGAGISIKKMNRATLSSVPVNTNNVTLNANPMIFKVYPATGGHIVEYNYYNERKDEQDQALHLVPSDLDLGTELAKIMTLEALKR